MIRKNFWELLLSFQNDNNFSRDINLIKFVDRFNKIDMKVGSYDCAIFCMPTSSDLNVYLDSDWELVFHLEFEIKDIKDNNELFIYLYDELLKKISVEEGCIVIKEDGSVCHSQLRIGIEQVDYKN